MRGINSVKVGEVYKSTSSDDFVVINVENYSNITIRFVDFPFETNVSGSKVKTGKIKNPMYPKLFGIGYRGVGKYVAKLGPTTKGFTNTPEYMAWVNMLSRCYNPNSPNRISNGTTYNQATVCDFWHNFQNFAEWYTPRYLNLSQNNIEKPSLDKDILGDSCFYAPENCCVIPQEINLALTHYKNLKGNPNQNIKFIRGKFVVNVSAGGILHCASFSNVDEAVRFRLTKKKENIDRLIEKYNHVLEQKVKDALSIMFI
jgi:hypothetical protein